MQIPTDAQFFSTIDPTKPDIAFLKNHFYREGRLKEEHCLYIIEKGTELLKKEPNLLEVDAPITGQHDRAVMASETDCFSYQSVAISTANT
jgi:serine/threonine-protein phosphatase 2B catalytic subunit